MRQSHHLICRLNMSQLLSSSVPRAYVLVVHINDFGIIALHLLLIEHHPTFRSLFLRALQLCEVRRLQCLDAVVAHWDDAVHAGIVVRMERAPLFLDNGHRVLIVLKTHI